MNVPDFEDLFPSTLEGTRYAMWGYSGGSVASTFAAERQASYAPELGFAGVVIGGLVPNVSDILSDPGSSVASLLPAALLGGESALQDHTSSPFPLPTDFYVFYSSSFLFLFDPTAFITVPPNQSPFSNLFSPFLSAVTSQYPEARAFLLSQLKTSGPYNATGFLAALHLNVNEGLVGFTGQNLNEYFVDGFGAYRRRARDGRRPRKQWIPRISQDPTDASLRLQGHPR